MITHQLPPTEHNILSDVWAVSFSLVVTSETQKKNALRPLLSFRHPYPYFKWKSKGEGGAKGTGPNTKQCKSYGMSPWSSPLEEEDGVWGISPSTGGLHLAFYPHQGACELLWELSTWSSQLPSSSDLLSTHFDYVLYGGIYLSVAAHKTWPNLY